MVWPVGILICMLRKVLRRGWTDSLASLGGASLFFTILVIPLVGFGLHFFVSGWVPMAAEFNVWAVYGLAATALVFFTLFAFHLACAPYRIERGRAERAEAQLNVAERTVRDLQTRRPNLIIKVDTVGSGGSHPDADGRFVFASASVLNIGTMPSIARNWVMNVYVNGKVIESQSIHLGDVTIGSVGGGYTKFSERNALYNKSDVIIQVGGALKGYLIALVSENEMPDGSFVEVELSCEDITGVMVFGRGEGGANSNYIPGGELVQKSGRTANS